MLETEDQRKEDVANRKKEGFQLSSLNPLTPLSTLISNKGSKKTNTTTMKRDVIDSFDQRIILWGR